MHYKSYTKAFKETAVQKYFNKGNRKFSDIASELGIPESTYWSWVTRSRSTGYINGMETKKESAEGWSAHKRFQACLDFLALPIEKQGEFLRKNGLVSEQILSWRSQCVEALSTSPTHASKKELANANLEIYKLRQDLRRKETALAEASALLILKKKADLIWGTADEK